MCIRDWSADVCSSDLVKKAAWRTLAIVAGIIVVNLSASRFFGRIDFTADKRFTLSSISINAVKQLPAPLHVTVLLDGDLPAGFERLKRATMDMLKDMKGYSSGRLSFSVVDPLDGNVQQQRENTEVLAGHGIMPTNLNVRSEESRVGKEFVSTVGSRG